MRNLTLIITMIMMALLAPTYGAVGHLTLNENDNNTTVTAMPPVFRAARSPQWHRMSPDQQADAYELYQDRQDDRRLKERRAKVALKSSALMIFGIGLIYSVPALAFIGLIGGVTVNHDNMMTVYEDMVNHKAHFTTESEVNLLGAWIRNISNDCETVVNDMIEYESYMNSEDTRYFVRCWIEEMTRMPRELKVADLTHRWTPPMDKNGNAWSSEQLDVLEALAIAIEHSDWDTSRDVLFRICIEAVAGSGKTTVVEGACDVIANAYEEDRSRYGFSLTLVAFNRTIADVLKSVLKDKMPDGADWAMPGSGTLNAHGHATVLKWLNGEDMSFELQMGDGKYLDIAGVVLADLLSQPDLYQEWHNNLNEKGGYKQVAAGYFSLRRLLANGAVKAMGNGMCIPGSGFDFDQFIEANYGALGIADAPIGHDIMKQLPMFWSRIAMDGQSIIDEPLNELRPDGLGCVFSFHQSKYGDMFRVNELTDKQLMDAGALIAPKAGVSKAAAGDSNQMVVDSYGSRLHLIYSPSKDDFSTYNGILKSLSGFDDQYGGKAGQGYVAIGGTRERQRNPRTLKLMAKVDGWQWSIKDDDEVISAFLDRCREHLDIDFSYAFARCEADTNDDVVTTDLVTIRMGFIDQIYTPAYFGLKAHRTFDIVMCDEVQDLSILQGLLLAKLCHEHSGVVLVGDRNQSLYAFSGASAESMDSNKESFGCESMPMTVCFRGTHTIANDVKTLMGAIDGKESNYAKHSSPEWIESWPHGEPSQVIAPHQMTDMVEVGDMVLSRLSAPLAGAAMDVLKRGVPVRLGGGGSMEDRVRSLSKTLDTRSCNHLSDLNEKVEAYLHATGKKKGVLTRLLTKYRNDKQAASKDQKYCEAVDNCEAIKALFGRYVDHKATGMTVDFCNDAKDDWIATLFGATSDEGFVVFSTIHRAKGLEADRVFIITDRETTDNDGEVTVTPCFMLPWSMNNEVEREQERNCVYVGITRAKSLNVYVTNRIGSKSISDAMWMLDTTELVSNDVDDNVDEDDDFEDIPNELIGVVDDVVEDVVVEEVVDEEVVDVPDLDLPLENSYLLVGMLSNGDIKMVDVTTDADYAQEWLNSMTDGIPAGYVGGQFLECNNNADGAFVEYCIVASWMPMDDRFAIAYAEHALEVAADTPDYAQEAIEIEAILNEAPVQDHESDVDEDTDIELAIALDDFEDEIQEHIVKSLDDDDDITPTICNCIERGLHGTTGELQRHIERGSIRADYTRCGCCNSGSIIFTSECDIEARLANQITRVFVKIEDDEKTDEEIWNAVQSVNPMCHCGKRIDDHESYETRECLHLLLSESGMEYDPSNQLDEDEDQVLYTERGNPILPLIGEIPPQIPGSGLDEEPIKEKPKKRTRKSMDDRIADIIEVVSAHRQHPNIPLSGKEVAEQCGMSMSTLRRVLDHIEDLHTNEDERAHCDYAVFGDELNELDGENLWVTMFYDCGEDLEDQLMVECDRTESGRYRTLEFTFCFDINDHTESTTDGGDDEDEPVDCDMTQCPKCYVQSGHEIPDPSVKQVDGGTDYCTSDICDWIETDCIVCFETEERCTCFDDDDDGGNDDGGNDNGGNDDDNVGLLESLVTGDERTSNQSPTIVSDTTVQNYLKVMKVANQDDDVIMQLNLQKDTSCDLDDLVIHSRLVDERHVMMVSIGEYYEYAQYAIIGGWQSTSFFKNMLSKNINGFRRSFKHQTGDPMPTLSFAFPDQIPYEVGITSDTRATLEVKGRNGKSNAKGVVSLSNGQPWPRQIDGVFSTNDKPMQRCVLKEGLLFDLINEAVGYAGDGEGITSIKKSKNDTRPIAIGETVVQMWTLFNLQKMLTSKTSQRLVTITTQSDKPLVVNGEDWEVMIAPCNSDDPEHLVGGNINKVITITPHGGETKEGRVPVQTPLFNKLVPSIAQKIGVWEMAINALANQDQEDTVRNCNWYETETDPTIRGA